MFVDYNHLSIYLAWVLVPVLSLFFCNFRIYFTTLGINYVFMATSVYLTAPYYVERRTDMDSNLMYFLGRTGNFTAEMIVMAVAGFFLCRILMNNYKEMFDTQEKLYKNQQVLYEKQAQLSENEERIKAQMDILGSMSDIYDYAAVIEPDTGNETEMRRRGDDTDEARRNAEKFSLSGGRFVRYIANEYMTAFEDFIRLSDIRERLADKKSISEEFVDTDEGWFRAQFIAVGQRDDGSPENVIYTIQNIDAEKKERDQLTEAAAALNYRISSIANIFMTVHEYDIKTGELIEIKSLSEYVNATLSRTYSDQQEMLKALTKATVDDSCYDDVMRFIDLSTLAQRLSNTDTIAIEFQNRKKLWRRGRFVASRRDDNGRPTRIMLLSEDIDNEKRERNELIDASERAIAASEAQSAFLSNMSDRLRTPINAVLDTNAIILGRSTDEEITRCANIIKDTETDLLDLVTDILDFSKIETGKIEIMSADYDLSAVINDLVDMIKPRMNDKRLTLDLEIDKQIPRLLRGDKARIKKVIGNLLTNAVRYTDRGSVRFCVSCENIPYEPDSVMLNVDVMDSGVGIRKDDMKTLFSGLVNDETQSHEAAGTVLSLTVAKRLLEMMDSTLVAESIYGLGSKFSFELKQAVAS